MFKNEERREDLFGDKWSESAVFEQRECGETNEGGAGSGRGHHLQSHAQAEKGGHSNRPLYSSQNHLSRRRRRRQRCQYDHTSQHRSRHYRLGRPAGSQGQRLRHQPILQPSHSHPIPWQGVLQEKLLSRTLQLL